MKTSFLSFCMVASSLFLFTHCKKDDSSPSSTAAVNYSPLTVGSSWTYNYTEGTSPTTTFTSTVTDKDTAVNGKTYKVLSSSDDSGNRYLAKVDSNYYRFASFAGIGSFEELYLKDNRPVNSTWTNTVTFTIPGSPIPLSADLVYLVKEKGIAYDVNGKQYKDVIHISADINLLGSSIGGGDFYYAQGIGLIENQIAVTAPGQSAYTTKQQLISYVIK